MITLEDCLAFCGLTEDEVQAIAEHEHIPEMAAIALAEYLTATPGGTLTIRDMILDDIAEARRSGDEVHLRKLGQVLRHYLETHPDARRGPLADPIERS